MKPLQLFENILWKLPRKQRRIITGDSILMRGRVTIHNGDTLIVCKAHNRIVSQGIKMLLQTISSNQAGANYGVGFSSQFNSSSGRSRIRVGTDISTETVEGTSALYAEVATDRNAASVIISRIGAGHYRVAWVSTWNSNTIAAVVLGEIGLFLCQQVPASDSSLLLPGVLNPSYDPYSVSPYLFSRLSSASGDFSSFTINTSQPLSIEWDLDVTF